MATTYQFKVKFGYADMETKNYTIPVYQAEDLAPATIMVRTQELNRVLGGASSSIEAANTYAAAMRQTFVSSEGASLSKIISCSTTSTTEEVIYSD